MIDYNEVSRTLENLLELASVLAVYEHVVGPLPEGPLTHEMVDQIDTALSDGLQKRFPVHEGLLGYGMGLGDGPDSALEVMPFRQAVHFCGFDFEDDFENYPEPVKAIVALGPCINSDNYDNWDQDSGVNEWWDKQRERFDLPPLDQLDATGILARLDGLRDMPAPWNGLHAIYQWFLGEFGNPFVDWPCADVLEAGWDDDVDWSMDSVDEMTEMWTQANKTVFAPMVALNSYAADHPEALGICFDLLLGRAKAQREAVTEIQPDRTLMEMICV